jgi:hypothetical protein
VSDGSSTEQEPARGPWFDPAVGARVLGDIQAEGLRAASDLVERLVHLVDGPVPDGGGGAEAPTGGRPAGPAGELAEMWGELLRRSVELWSLVPAPGGAPDGADRAVVDVTGPGPTPRPDPIVIRLSAGDAASTEVWLHNGRAIAVGPLAVRPGPLADVEGRLLDAQVAVDPAEVPELVARSSRGVLVTLRVASDVGPGTYRGVVQVVGAPDVWLPMEVVVAAGDP